VFAAVYTPPGPCTSTWAGPIASDSAFRNRAGKPRTIRVSGPPGFPGSQGRPLSTDHTPPACPNPLPPYYTLHLEPLNPPDLYAGDLGKAEGVQSAAGDVPACSQGLDCLGLVGLAGVIGSADAEAIELAEVEAHELGGVLSAMNTEPASTKDAVCVELIGTAEGAATAEPEALEAYADDEAGCGLYVTP
jgi:hypothetical protein